MEKFSRSKRYNLISLFTFLIIAITFGYYYFFYVSSRESQFNEKAFRVIENIGKNVGKKYDNYFSNVNKAIKHINTYDDGAYIKNENELKKGFNEYDVPEEIEVVSIVSSKDKVSTEIFWKQLAEDEMGMVISLNLKKAVLCKFKTTNLFKITLRKDFFKKFVVLSQKTNSADSGHKDYQFDILYSDIPLVINHRVGHNSLDTTLFSNGALSSTRLIHVGFSDNEHNLYISPVDIGNNTTLYIGGIIEKDFFRTSTFSLKPFSFSIIIVILILLILLLPFLKLYLISENERLNTIDAVFSFISIVVGSAFIFVLMLNWQSRNENSIVNQRKLLEGYTNNIEKELKAEIKESLTLLSDFDDLPKNPKNSKEKQTYTDFEYDKKDINFIDGKLYPQFNQKDKTAIFWTNKKADQLIKWSTKTNTPHVNVGTRPYFKRVINGVLWNDPDLFREPFFMHAILSMTDGNNYTMFSKESHYDSICSKLPDKFIKEIQENNEDEDILKPKVVVLAKKLSSLKDLPLPSNISYMLVDKKGEVIYHQVESKILQENLLNETGFNQELNAALQTHIDTFFTASYDGIKRSFYVKPVGKLPIYLVTSVNAEHERISNLQALALSNILYLLLIFILSAQIGVFVLINRKPKKKTAGRNLLFCWFWPDKRKHWVYIVLSGYLIVVILLYFISGIYNSIYISLSFFSLLATFVIFILKWHHDTCESNYVNRNFIYLFLILGFNVLLIYNSFSDDWSSWNYGYLVFIGLSLFCFIVIKYFLTDVIDYSEKPVSQSYSVFVFLLVLSLGLIPVNSFYNKTFNLEKELYERSMQLDLATKLGTIPKKDFSAQLLLSQKLNDPFIIVSTLKANRYDSVCRVNASIDRSRVLTKSESGFIKKIRFTYDTTMYNSTSIDFLQCEASRLYTWSSINDSSILYGQQPSIMLKSVAGRFEFFPSDNGFNYSVFLLTGFLIYCFVIFYSIRYWASRIFLLSLPHKKKKNEFELILNSFKFIYLISLPHSGVKRYLNEKYKKAYIIPVRECDQQDFVKEKLSWIKVKKYENVILYDSDSFTEQLLKSKTKLIIELLKLMSKEDPIVKKLILVSNTHPSYKVKKIKGKNGDDTTTLDQYLNVLGNFKRIFFPFGFVNEYIKEEENEELTHLFNECDCEDSGSWSNWKNGFSNDKFSEESVLNVQSLSQIQYFSIWNGLEKREQYLVYDLAQDGLANYKNMGVINNLISKGILKYKNMQLELFNKSFNNFVLTNIDREESLQIEHDSKKSGNWSNLQLPIIMIIFALFAFLFITQQDVFNSIVAWLGTAIISLPLLLRSLSSLSSLKFGKS